MTFILTQEALRNQIIVCVDDQYINQLHNNITEYATVTPKELLDHIWKMYRDIKNRQDDEQKEDKGAMVTTKPSQKFQATM